MSTELLIQTFVNCIQLSSFYALLAIGLSLVFGVAGIANLAHGEFYMLGAYAVWWFSTLSGLNYIVSVLLAMVLVGGLRRMRDSMLTVFPHPDSPAIAVISPGLISYDMPSTALTGG